MGVNVLNKEPVHQKAVGKTGGADQDHGEPIVSNVGKVSCTNDVVNEQAHGMVKLEGIDSGLVFLGGQPETKRSF